MHTPWWRRLIDFVQRVFSAAPAAPAPEPEPAPDTGTRLSHSGNIVPVPTGFGTLREAIERNWNGINEFRAWCKDGTNDRCMTDYATAKKLVRLVGDTYVADDCKLSTGYVLGFLGFRCESNDNPLVQTATAEQANRGTFRGFWGCYRQT